MKYLKLLPFVFLGTCATFQIPLGENGKFGSVVVGYVVPELPLPSSSK